MKAFILSCLAASTLATVANAAGLDFSLHRTTISADGAATGMPYIMDGDSKIFLHYAGNWQVSDSPEGLDFVPPSANARIRIEKYGGPIISIDDPGSKLLSQQNAARLPEGAKDVQTLPPDFNPLPIFGWTDLEVALNYDFAGQHMRRSLMFVAMRPGRSVIFSVTAPEADFVTVYKQSRAILSSWFEPSKDLPPDLARKYEDGGVVKPQ